MPERLVVLSGLVDDNSYIIDIGCDHALLDTYLLDSKKNIRVIASDINIDALNQGINNAKDYNIDFRLGDGLKVINDDTIDTIVIAGSGGLKQIEIIKNDINRLDTVNKIILQPNNEVFKVRKEISALGFYICDEKIVYEKKHFYNIIVFKRGFKKYSYEELFLGPILIKNKDVTFNKWLEKIYREKNIILPKLGIKDETRKKEIIKQIKIIKKRLNLL